jgi:hypothetical protein
LQTAQEFKGQEGGLALRAQFRNEIQLTVDAVFALSEVLVSYFKVVEKHRPVVGAYESGAVSR